MRKALSVISHILVVFFALTTVVYNVFLIVDLAGRAEKTTLDLLVIVLLVLYSLAVLRVGFEMFIAAGALAYGVGRVKKSHVILRAAATATGYFFIVPHAVALFVFAFSGAYVYFGSSFCCALAADLAVYYIFRWLSFLASVSEVK